MDGFATAVLSGPVKEVRSKGPNAPLLLRLFLAGLDRVYLDDIDTPDRWLHTVRDSVPPGTTLLLHGDNAELVIKPRRSRGLSSPLPS